MKASTPRLTANTFAKLVRSVDNPVTHKELRSRMRGGRAFLILAIYLVLMSCMVGLVYAVIASSSEGPGQADISQVVGKTVFALVVGIELSMICLIAPALTAGAVAGERERQTFDLLRTTLLPARSLVWGKLLSALSFQALLLVAAFPLQSLAYIFGGVSMGEVIAAFVFLLVTALSLSALGLFVSTIFRSSLGATVVSYAAMAIIIMGIPSALGTTLGFLGGMSSTNWYSSLTPVQQTIFEITLATISYILVALNAPAALIASEVMLLANQALYFTTLPLSNGFKFPILSPWITYSIFYGLLSIGLVWWSIRRVRRIED